MVDWCLLNKFSAQLIILYLKVLYFPSLFPAALSEGKKLLSVQYFVLGLWKNKNVFRENSNKENLKNKDNFLFTFNSSLVALDLLKEKPWNSSSNSWGIKILSYGVNNSAEYLWYRLIFAYFYSSKSPNCKESQDISLIQNFLHYIGATYHMIFFLKIQILLYAYTTFITVFSARRKHLCR